VEDVDRAEGFSDAVDGNRTHVSNLSQRRPLGPERDSAG
jgi:hypothetical protein